MDRTALSEVADSAAWGGALAAWAWSDAWLAGRYDRANAADLPTLDPLQDRVEAARVALLQARAGDASAFRSAFGAAVGQVRELLEALRAVGASPPEVVTAGLATAEAWAGLAAVGAVP